MGIYVGGTGSANHMDDYEEGTFTPVVKGSTTAGSYRSSTNPEGFYIKVGRKVEVWMNVEGTLSGASGDTQIGGLPFSTASNNSSNGYTAVYGAGNVSYWSGYGSKDVLGSLSPVGNTILYFHCDNGSSTGGNASAGNATHNGHIHHSYFTD